MNDTGNASDIINNGTVVDAVFMGDSNYGVNQISTDLTLNGVTFGYQIGGYTNESIATFNTYSNITLGRLEPTDASQEGSGAPSSWNSTYGELLSWGDGSGYSAPPFYFDIIGLTVGHSYEVQLFTPWWNQPFDGVEFSDGANVSAPVAIGVSNGGVVTQTPQYVIGTFTATSSEQDFYMLTNGGGGEDFVNGPMVLLDTTAATTPTPEPSSMLVLLGWGVALIAFKRWRMA